MKNAVNFALFQVGWFACVLGAARGYGVAAAVFSLFLLGVHLTVVAGAPRPELARLAAITACGVVIDSGLGIVGVLHYEGRPVWWMCPPWIAALWALFASTFPFSLSWLVRRPRLSLVLGAVFGPVSYAAGVRLGALTFGEPLVRSIAVTSAVWALAMVTLPRLGDRARDMVP